jgi:hypothetical protein
MALVAIVIIFIAARRRAPGDLDNDRRSAHWMGTGIGIGLAIGMPTGLAIGIALDNIPVGVALGPALGTAMGVAIGAALEARHKSAPEPEQAREPISFGRFSLAAGIVLFLAMLVLAAILLQRCGPIAP